MSKAKDAKNFTTEVATLTIPNPTSDITALKTLVGDVAVATQISNAIAALKLSETYEAKGSANAVKTALLGDAAEAYNTLGKLEDAVIATKKDLDGLQISGVNLMLDTKAYGGNGGANYTVAGVLQAEGYNGFTVRRGENTSDANALQFKLAYAFQPGESYTLSFWGKGSGAAQALITGYAYPCTSVSSEGTTSTDAGGANTFNVTGDWKRYWVTFTMGAWATVPTGKELWLRARNSARGRVLDVCGLKLEKGNKATDWSPAPEDVENRISTAETQIAQNATEISLRAMKTEVEGGRNYLPALSTATGAISPYVQCQYDADNGAYILTATGGTGNYAHIHKSGIACRALAGKKCRFHAEAISRSRTELDPRAYVIFFDSAGASLGTWRVRIDQLSIGMIVPTNAATMQYIIRLDQNMAQAAGDIAGFKGLKLEVGTMDTDWTPSPEDPARSVKTSSVTVNGSGI